MGLPRGELDDASNAFDRRRAARRGRCDLLAKTAHAISRPHRRWRIHAQHGLAYSSCRPEHCALDTADVSGVVTGWENAGDPEWWLYAGVGEPRRHGDLAREGPRDHRGRLARARVFRGW